MVINGTEVAFDIFNPETLRRFNEFVHTYQNGMTEISGQNVGIDDFPKMYQLVVTALDGLFGPGMGVRICGSEVSAAPAVNAVLDLLEEHQAQVNDMQRKSERIVKLFGQLSDEK